MTAAVEEFHARQESLLAPQGPASGIVVRTLASLVLLFAAFMKWEQLPVIERMGTGLLHNPWLVAGQIIAEAGLAFWLLSGLLPLWSRRAALATFAVFACFTLYKAVTGAASCGCFGQFQVNPWVTLALDIIVVAALYQSLRAGKMHNDPIKPPQGIRWRVAFLIIGILAATSLTLWRMPTASAAAEGIVVANGGLMVLEPEKWVGKPWPLQKYIREDKAETRKAESRNGGTELAELMRGRWTVVLYSSDCDHCRQVVPGLARNARQAPAGWCFIELPPYARPGEQLIGRGPADSAGRGIVLAQLTDQHEWFAQTPVLVEMQDGIVQKVRVGDQVSVEGMKAEYSNRLVSSFPEKISEEESEPRMARSSRMNALSYPCHL